MSLKFSIVIPVFNDEEDLKLVLNAIQEQDFPAEDFETFVVDNGSSDNSVQVASSFNFVNVLLEHQNLSSPYSCRNRGIEQANGDIIVLLDASCKPVTKWLYFAYCCFEESEADILGGDVQFDFKNNITAPKIYDSLNNIKMKQSIEERNVAKTANLFVKHSVFKSVGLFPEKIRSGGDVYWTNKATSMGHKLYFCDKAIVFKTARGFFSLIRKQWRVSVYKSWLARNRQKKVKIIKNLRNIIVPISPFSLRKIYNSENIKKYNVGFISYLLVFQIVRYVVAVGKIWGVIKFRTSNVFQK